jgi:hypothetical protein
MYLKTNTNEKNINSISYSIIINVLKDKNTNEVTIDTITKVHSETSYKYQNPNLVSVLVASKKRRNSEFKFMAETIISTTVLVSSNDLEEESRLARTIDNDLSIKGKHEVNTVQTFDKDDNSKLLYISMTSRYKGFDYVFDFIETTNENVYKLDAENGKDFKVKLIK